MNPAAHAPRQSDQQRRGFWLRHLHRWHWISSALCLIGMLLFAITGFTLNHAGAIEASPLVTQKHAVLPSALLKALADSPSEGRAALPLPLRDWAQEALDVRVGGAPADWTDDEIYLSLPEPGGDAWLSIDRGSGEAEYEHTDRGWVSYLNDLHKGRNAGAMWGWFIDVFALACVVFSITGLFLLKLHAGNRRATWPLVGLGVVIPLLLALIFIH